MDGFTVVVNTCLESLLQAALSPHQRVPRSFTTMCPMRDSFLQMKVSLDAGEARAAGGDRAHRIALTRLLFLLDELIYEDVQRSEDGIETGNGWSSSEFESYDEQSDNESKLPTRSKVRSSRVTSILCHDI